MHHLTSNIELDYAVVAMDCRGQACKSNDTYSVIGTTVSGHTIKGIDGDINDLYYRKVYLDALLLSRIVASFEDINDENMITFERDQGGAIAIALAALNPNIKKCSMKYPILGTFNKYGKTIMILAL